MPQLALTAESTLTDRYQTTVPGPVRKALRLDKKDKIKYSIQSDGSVLISRAELEEIDPVIGEFLSFLATDMQNHPEKLQPLTDSMRGGVESLISDINIDMDAALSEEDE